MVSIKNDAGVRGWVQLTVSRVPSVYGLAKEFHVGSVIGDRGDGEVGEEEFPTVIAPKDFQTKEGFIALDAPELTTPLHPALHLATGRFDGSRAQGFAPFLACCILHPLFIAAVVVNGGVSDFEGSWTEGGFEFLQGANDPSHLVGFDLLEQGLDPLPRRWGIGTVDLIGHGPEIGIGVE